MPLLRNIASGIRSLFQKKRADRELDEELRGFMDMAAEESKKQGGSEKDARRTVRLERGSLEAAKELVRSAGWESLLETTWQDLCYGLRQLRRSPGFTAVALLTLALGIGANTAIFSVVNAVLLRPLPYPQANRIVVLGTSGKNTTAVGWVSQPDFQDWHNQGALFDAMAYYSSAESSVSVGTSAEYANGAAVSAEFFRVFSVHPELGRLFSRDEETPGGPHAVLISDSLWQRDFARSPSVIGQPLRSADTGSGTIIGVLPKGFRFPGSNDFWVPMAEFQQPGEAESRGAANYSVVGRLKTDAGTERAGIVAVAISRDF